MNKIGALMGLAGIFVGGVALLIVVPLRAEVASLKAERAKDQAELSHLKSKLEGLDHRAGREGDQRSAPVIETSEPAPRHEERPQTVKPVTAVKPPTEGVEEFADLQKKVMDGTATEEERDKFWKLTREKPGLLDDVIRQMEKAAADDPRNKEVHRRLAEAYLAKLMAVPDGIQKGIWSNKMIAEEKKILEIDPGDWEARFSIATNYSFWPEQFNKRPDAIKEFETLRKLQESRPADPKYAQTYLQLRQLYLKEGRTDDAKAVLEEGLRLYPDDAELMKARDGVK